MVHFSKEKQVPDTPGSIQLCSGGREANAKNSRWGQPGCSWPALHSLVPKVVSYQAGRVTSEWHQNHTRGVKSTRPRPGPSQHHLSVLSVLVLLTTHHPLNAGQHRWPNEAFMPFPILHVVPRESSPVLGYEVEQGIVTFYLWQISLNVCICIWKSIWRKIFNSKAQCGKKQMPDVYSRKNGAATKTILFHSLAFGKPSTNL